MLGVSTQADESPAGAVMEDLEMVAEDLMAGIKSGNAPMVARALRTAHLICSNYESGELEGSKGPGRSFDKYSPNKR